MKKNIILPLSLVSTFSLFPVALSAGCNNNGSNDDDKNYEAEKDEGGKAIYANDRFKAKAFEQDDDGKIILGVTFTEGKPQWAALQGIIDVYNKLGQDKAWKAAHPEYLPIKLQNIGSGYQAGFQDVSKKLGEKVGNVFYNLVAGYTNVASELAAHGMLLNFETGVPGATSISLDENIAPSFRGGNKDLTSNIRNDGTWVLPVMKSSIGLGVNKPLMSYIFETMLSAGATLNADLNDFKNDITTNGVSDKEAIKTKWGEPLEVAKLKEIIGTNYEISKSTFTVGQKLLEFIQKAQKLFKNSNKESASYNKDLHIMGIDDIIGLLQTWVYSSIDADRAKMYITKDSKGNVHYSGIKDSDSPVGKAMRNIFDSLKQCFDTGALVLQGPGQYTSTDQIYHSFALGASSTAGYTYNYNTGKNSYFFTTKTGNIKLDINNNYNTVSYVHKKAGNNDVVFIGASDTGHVNKIVKSTTTEPGKFDYVAANAEADGKLADLITKIGELSADPTTATTLNNFKHYVSMVKDGDNSDASKKIKELASVSANGITSIGKYKQGNKTFEAFYWTKEAINKLCNFAKVEASGTLQANEFTALDIPTKWTENDQYNVVYTQGPSLMGIHANEREDKATRLFVKFLLSNDKYDFVYKLQGKREETVKSVTPSIFLEQKASYVLPKVDFEKGNPFATHKNKYLSKAYEAFSNTVTHEDTWKAFEDYGDTNSDAFRDSLASAFRGVYEKSKNNQPINDYKTEIVNKVVELCSTFINK